MAHPSETFSGHLGLGSKYISKGVKVFFPGEKGSTSWKRLKVETQMSLIKRRLRRSNARLWRLVVATDVGTNQVTDVSLGCANGLVFSTLGFTELFTSR